MGVRRWRLMPGVCALLLQASCSRGSTGGGAGCLLPTSLSNIPAGVAHSLVLSHTLNFSCRSASRYSSCDSWDPDGEARVGALARALWDRTAANTRAPSVRGAMSFCTQAAQRAASRRTQALQGLPHPGYAHALPDAPCSQRPTRTGARCNGERPPIARRTGRK